MSKEETSQVTKRATRSSSSVTQSNSSVEPQKTSDSHPRSSPSDLLYGEEPTSLETLLSSFPGRRPQILELLRLLGPPNSPLLPVFLYGGSSTGKTSVILQIFRHLNRPFVYSSCRTCYSPRILFESTLNQLLLHRRNASNGYSSAKRCERPADFVNYLREALTDMINNLRGHIGQCGSKGLMEQGNGRMIYMIFDNMELIREWDKSSVIIPLLFKLCDILKMPEVAVIFISNASIDTYYSNAGFVEPIPVHFPDYTEDDIRQIFMRNQANPKLYSSFLDIVLRPFCRITRRVNELAKAFSTLFRKYCEPLSDLSLALTEDTKRKLFSHLQLHIAPSLNDFFRVPSQTSSEVQARKEKGAKKGSVRPLVAGGANNELDFHMSTSAKYLLISAFLASRNPATLDAALFDSTGGSDNRKRKRKSSETSMQKKESAEQELLKKGPGTFPLERLLAIFQCIMSVGEEMIEDQQDNDGVGAGANSEIFSDIFLQLSTLCNANFISKGRNCPLEGFTRYRCTIDEEMALKVARSLKFPLSKYLYRR